MFSEKSANNKTQVLLADVFTCSIVDMSTEIFRRKLVRFLQNNPGRSRRSQTVPSKISEMELAAYDTVAYNSENKYESVDDIYDCALSETAGL